MIEVLQYKQAPSTLQQSSILTKGTASFGRNLYASADPAEEEADKVDGLVNQSENGKSSSKWRNNERTISHESEFSARNPNFSKTITSNSKYYNNNGVSEDSIFRRKRQTSVRLTIEEKKEEKKEEIKEEEPLLKSSTQTEIKVIQSTSIASTIMEKSDNFLPNIKMNSIAENDE